MKILFINMYLFIGAYAPILLPTLDRCLHGFGICFGH